MNSLGDSSRNSARVAHRGECDALLSEARRCRRLAQSMSDDRTVDALTAMAQELEARASADPA